MAQAPRDQNRIATLLGTSNADGVTPVVIYADPVTHRLLVDIPSGSGTVSSVSVVTANGFAGSVADPTTTPAITLSTTVTGIVKGNGTALSAAVAGTDYTSLAFKTIAVSGQSDVVADTPEDTLTLAAGSGVTITTNAGTDTVTIAATGVASSIVVGTTTITSGANTRILYDNSGTLGEYTITGTGTVVAMQTNPTLSGLTMTDATNIVLDTTTGTKIGTATSQKLAFYNSTPIVKPSGDVATALSNLGLVATPTVIADTVSTANEATDTTCFPLFVTASGTQTLQPKNNTNLTFNSNTASLGATLITATTSVTSASILASSNDSGALGASGTAFSDLFLASGGVINWNAANMTLTHASGSLTLAGGPLILAENSSIQLDPAGSADGKYTGITITATAGYTQAFGDLVYLSVTDSRWELADADAAATAGPVALAMVVIAGTDGNPCTLLLQGVIRADAKFPTMTVGATQYVGETAGAIQGSIPTGADNIIRTVGYALTADELYFNPSTDWQVTVA